MWNYFKYMYLYIYIYILHYAYEFKSGMIVWFPCLNHDQHTAAFCYTQLTALEHRGGRGGRGGGSCTTRLAVRSDHVTRGRLGRPRLAALPGERSAVRGRGGASASEVLGLSCSRGRRRTGPGERGRQGHRKRNALHTARTQPVCPAVDVEELVTCSDRGTHSPPGKTGKHRRLYDRLVSPFLLVVGGSS